MSGEYKTYKTPARELAAIRDLGMSYQDAFTQHDGFFSGRYIERSRSERGGRIVITVQERGMGWAVEITLDACGDVAEVVPLSPARARELEE